MVQPVLPLYRILVLKQDRIYAHAIREQIAAICRGDCVIVTGTAEAEHALEDLSPDLFISDLDADGSDVFTFLEKATRPPRQASHVLVLSSRREPQVLAAICALPIDGMLDPATEGPSELAVAVARTMAGRSYWSKSIIDAITEHNGFGISGAQRLTATEKLVLAAIGDGSDNEDAAERLGLTTNTVRNHREKIYGKLGVKHKGELVRVAAQLGYVCISAHGVIRPGYEQLAAARNACLSRHVLRGQS